VRRFSRIIPASIPTRAAFLAAAAVGKAPPRDPDKGRDWRGCSVFETPAQARAIATEHHLRVRDRIALNFPLSLTARFPHLIGLSPNEAYNVLAALHAKLEGLEAMRKFSAQGNQPIWQQLSERDNEAVQVLVQELERLVREGRLRPGQPGQAR